MLRSTFIGAVAVATAVLVAGCGGSGSGSTESGGAAVLYLTGAANPNYQHVWATVTKVDLVSTSGQTTNAYDGTTSGGQVVDLSSLSSATGPQYFMLTSFGAPAATVSSVNVTVNSALSVVPTGATTAVSATLPGASGASTVLSVKLPSPQNVVATGNLVLNFNLANWSLNGSTVTAPNNQFVQCGPPTGPGGPPNVVPGIYFGAVSALAGTAPTQTFTLGHGAFSVNVATSSTTVLYNSDGSANPTLAAGDTVVVAGAYDSTTKVLNATAIIIQVGTTVAPPAQARGLVTADSLTSNTITLQESGCGGFMPTQTTLTVDVTSATTFIDASGVTDSEAQFFAALTAGTSTIQVTGTVSGSTITATSVQIQPAPGTRPMLVAFRGAVSDVSTTADTFTLTVNLWEGWKQSSTAVSVVPTANTQYYLQGAVVTASAFFAGLTSSSVVSVRGTLDPSTSTVTAAIVASGPTSGGGFHF